MGKKFIKATKGRPRVELSGPTRGADSNELTSVKVNNEIDFCKVYSLKRKEAVERIFLKNRISYFVKWQEQSFFKRLFSSESKEGIIFVICIHDTMVDKAKELLEDMKDVKILV